MVFKYLHINLSPEQIKDLVDGRPGVMESFLHFLKDKIDLAIAERRFRPTKKRSGSSTRGSSLSLNQTDSDYEAPSPVAMKIASTPRSNISKHAQGTNEEIQVSNLLLANEL